MISQFSRRYPLGGGPSFPEISPGISLGGKPSRGNFALPPARGDFAATWKFGGAHGASRGDFAATWKFGGGSWHLVWRFRNGGGGSGVPGGSGGLGGGLSEGIPTPCSKPPNGG